MAARQVKTQKIGRVERLLNLVAFLLKHDGPVSWTVIRSQVSGYKDTDKPRAASGSMYTSDGSSRAAEQQATYTADSKFSAARRRFSRDKDLLQSLGVRIEYVPHNSMDTGGYYIRRESFFHPAVQLTPEERQILACLHTTVALEGKSPVLNSLLTALQKLRFDEGLHDTAERDHRLPVFKLGTAEQANVQDNLAVLIDTAKARKITTFFYHSMHRDAVSERAVEPYGVFLKDGKWYLVGRCTVGGAVRMFRLDRILTQVQVNRENPGQADFKRPRDFSLKKYLGGLPWEAAPEPEVKKLYNAKIAFNEDAWWMARDSLADSRCQVKVKGKGAVVTIPVYREEPLMRWLLKFGPHAVVLSPKRLRNLLIDTVKEIRQRHT